MSLPMTRTGFRCCNLDGKYYYYNQTPHTHTYNSLSYINSKVWRTVCSSCLSAPHRNSLLRPEAVGTQPNRSHKRRGTGYPHISTGRVNYSLALVYTVSAHESQAPDTPARIGVTRGRALFKHALDRLFVTKSKNCITTNSSQLVHTQSKDGDVRMKF